METEITDKYEPTPWWAGRSSGSYDPMHPKNLDQRKHDDPSDGLDWEEIILTTQEDFEADRHSYSSEGYSSRFMAEVGLAVWLDSIVENMERELPHLHTLPRVGTDIRECLTVADRREWGKPRERMRDIRRGIENVLRQPEANPVVVWRAESDLFLRRYSAGPFVIVYAYMLPTLRYPYGAVSIRAVRLSRVGAVASGVKELTAEAS